MSLFFRIYKLVDYPPSLFIDEYNVGLPGLEILKGISKPLWYGIGWYGTPAGSFYYFAFMMKIFGANEWGLRLAWAIPGALTIPFAFLFFRYIFGVLPALLGAIFLAFSPLHNHLSRWAHGSVIVSFLLYVALSLYEVMKRRKNLIEQFLLCLSIGFVLAGMMYVYVGGRVLAGAFCLYIIVDHFLLSINTKSIVRAIVSFWQRGIILCVFILLIIPFLRYGFQHRVELLARTKQVSIIKKEFSFHENVNALVKNIKLYIGMFINTPDPNPRHTPHPEKSVFGLFYSILFVFGAIFFFLKKNVFVTAFFTLFFGIMSAGILSNEGPSIFRTMAIISLFYGLCGYGIYNLTKYKLIRYLVLTIWIITLFKENTEFIDIVNNPPRIQYDAFTYREGSIARKAVEVSKKGQTVYLSPDFFWFSSVKFNRLARGQAASYRIYNIGIEHLQDMRNAIAIVDNAYSSLQDYYQLMYPQVMISVSDIKKSIPFTIIDFGNIKNEVFVNKNIGLTASWYIDPLKKIKLGTRIEPTVYYAWDSENPVMLDVFYGEWDGFFVPPENGMYLIRGVADDYGGIELYDDDKLIISSPLQHSYNYFLQMEQKPYRIKFTYQNTGGAKSYYVTMKRPSKQDFEIISPLWLSP